MTTAIQARVVGVDPMDCNVRVNFASPNEVEKWRDDLKARHPYVEKTVIKKRFDIESEYPIVCFIKIILDEEADYRQYLALRTEMNGQTV